MKVHELLQFITQHYENTVYRIFDGRTGQILIDGRLASMFSESYDYMDSTVTRFTYRTSPNCLVITIEVESCGSTQDRISTI